MPEIPLHPTTAARLQHFRSRPSHAVVLLGPAGSGKFTLAAGLAADLLALPPEKLATHAYFRHLAAGKEASISIEAIRELEHFLSRRVPGEANRVVLIENAGLMSAEAQSALLKTLEEPPAQTYLILTATPKSLLPTIVSRTTRLDIIPPDEAALTAYFIQTGHPADSVKRNYMLAGGLPGLLTALLESDDDEQPLVQAAQTARQLLRSTAFERLVMADALAKQKQQCLEVLQVLQRMAHVGLLSGKQATVWQKLLQASYEAEAQLLSSGQPKLVLTNLMLNL